MNFIRNFMLVIGPISSAFDFLTFYVMLVVLKADEALFQTGWFVESLSTQVLVIFIIRTRGNPFKSRAHPVLVATSLAVVRSVRYCHLPLWDRISASFRRPVNFMSFWRRWWWPIWRLSRSPREAFTVGIG